MKPLSSPTTLLTALLTCLVAIPAQAQSITADRDTFVNKGSPDTNYGGNTTVQVRNDGGSALSKTKDIFAYVSFDLSSISTPVGDASLDLEFTAGSFDYAFQVYGIPDLANDEFFNESTLTLNTAYHAYKGPTNAGTEGSLETGELQLLGSFDAPGSFGSVSFTSANLLDFLNADTNGRATFILYSTYQTGTAAAEFASHEHATLDGPTLELGAVIPEPSALGLVGGLGVLLFATARRRRLG